MLLPRLEVVGEAVAGEAFVDLCSGQDLVLKGMFLGGAEGSGEALQVLWAWCELCRGKSRGGREGVIRRTGQGGKGGGLLLGLRPWAEERCQSSGTPM